MRLSHVSAVVMTMAVCAGYGQVWRVSLVFVICYSAVIIAHIPEARNWTAYGGKLNKECLRTSNTSRCSSVWSLWRLASDGDTIYVYRESRSQPAARPRDCEKLELFSACSLTIIGVSDADVDDDDDDDDDDDGNDDEDDGNPDDDDKDGRPTISGCHSSDDANSTVTIVLPPNEPNCRLSIRGLRFSNINLRILGASVDFTNVSFYNATVFLKSSGSQARSASFVNAEMKGHSKCNHLEGCTPSSVIGVSGLYSAVTVANSSFVQAGVKIDLGTDCEVVVSRTSFDNEVVADRAVIGGLLVGLWPLTTNSTVHVDGCSFTNQFNWSPVDAVMNIFESALRVYLFREALGMDVLRRTLRPDVDYNVTVLVSDSVFEHNERAITVQGLAGVRTITVQDTRFLYNIAMHAGAGILLLTGKDLLIRRCTFEGNSAGNPRYADVLLHNELVVISGEEASVRSKCCKGAVRLIGKGGAIRVQHGSATLENSTFENNTARIAGGTIFVDRGSQLLVRASRFSNAVDRRFASQQGEIVYSNGRVNVDGGDFNVVSATSHISLFQHSGDRWSIEVYDISLRCPVGFRIRVTNTTSYRVVDTLGLKRSYMLDQLSYFCESCDRYKYSTDYGFMTYTLQYGVLDYFALMINEQYPEVSKEEQYYLHDIVCKSCPYGGTCENRIQALPNFWGYQVGSAVRFQLCPKGYCCANPADCVSFNTCAEHRTGTLCGVCQPGYTEALFSPNCVPDETCGPVWIWPFAFGTGILYFLFLLFQKDIREFIFSGDSSISWKSLLHGDGKEEDDAICGEDEERDSMMKLEAFPRQPELPTDTNAPTNGNSLSPNALPPAESRENGELVAIADGEQRDRKSSNGVVELDDKRESVASEQSAEAPKTDIGAIMLIMVMYYFQDAMLFNVKTVADKPETRFWSQLKTVLLGLFKFRLEVTQFVDNVCVLPGLTASRKLLAKTLMVPFVLLNFVVIFALHCCASAVRRPAPGRPADDPKRETFTTRMATGFMLALLFMYQQLATAAFQLLNCVVVGDRSVLFLEGTITCYEDWQYGVIAYAIFGIIPFFFALLIGPGLLKERRMSVGLFFCACLFPLPFFVYWLASRAADFCPRRGPSAGRKSRPSEAPPEASEAEAAVLKVLQGPFRDLSSRYTGSVCWAGVLIFRRLMLILFYTFINNSLIRIICMLFFSFVILIVHVHVQPYRDPRVNIAGSVSISALMIVGGINLIRASFEVAEYIPQGPNQLLISAMKESENVLMLWIPLITMAIIMIVFLYKLLCLIGSKCSYCK